MNVYLNRFLMVISIVVAAVCIVLAFNLDLASGSEAAKVIFFALITIFTSIALFTLTSVVKIVAVNYLVTPVSEMIGLTIINLIGVFVFILLDYLVYYQFFSELTGLMIGIWVLVSAVWVMSDIFKVIYE
ncbi:MAG: hypothetical protein PQJ61_07605 [Spirochaetales bacterium]|uniref:Uncharacterized protein n=1 Tax=Candidatus Thalassospirochaeta sargassi TaxID=3119039 RepID=A0AAJ1ICA8_9SPIO|nr:hypothetical protein [Spirochaetales bacterium]